MGINQLISDTKRPNRSRAAHMALHALLLHITEKTPLHTYAQMLIVYGLVDPQTTEDAKNYGEQESRPFNGALFPAALEECKKRLDEIKAADKGWWHP